jgi:hypothetical protein
MIFAKLIPLPSLIICFLLFEPVLLARQELVKCKYESKELAPKYRIGWRTYSVAGPKTLLLAISIDTHHFSRDEMVALAHRIKRDFCRERKLDIAILDSYKAARAFAPTIEKEWFQKHWRGDYFLDRDSGEERITFSTVPDRPRDEVIVNLGATIQEREQKR